ncbi:acyl carrier protein [Kitasatospora phosalacinea]|uniref:acyl carrier protein n=1 Tax=Kitasatospora phosalacinea TaxID=2065 RepID=UPI003646660C
MSTEAMSTEEIRAFVLTALSAMNYDTTGIDDDTLLGPAGADLESLSLAELGVRVEERFGVRFDDDEAEQLGTMTVGEFAAAVAARVRPAAAAGH